MYQKIILLLILGLSVGFNVGCNDDSKAQGSTIRFSGDAAGYFFTGTADSNQDGSPNLINNQQGLSSELGSFNMGTQFEFIRADPIEPCELPSGGEGAVFNLVQGTQVITILSDNDQILTEFTELVCCFALPGNPDPTFSLDGTAAVIGGTGEFTDATGTITYTGTGTNEFSAPDGSGVFGEVNLVATGTIDKGTL